MQHASQWGYAIRSLYDPFPPLPYREGRRCGCIVTVRCTWQTQRHKEHPRSAIGRLKAMQQCLRLLSVKVMSENHWRISLRARGDARHLGVTIWVRWEAVNPELAEYRAGQKQVCHQTHDRRRRQLSEDLCHQKRGHPRSPSTG